MMQSTTKPLSHVALAVALLAFVIRIHDLGADSLWFDEATTARNLTIPFQQVIAEARLGHGPFYLLLKLLPHLQYTEFSLRYPSVLFGAVGVATMFSVGRRLLGAHAGALAALLLTLSPMHVWYCREARSYSMTLSMTLLVVAVFLGLSRRPHRMTWSKLVVAQSALLYAHLFGCLTMVWQTLLVVTSALRDRLSWPLHHWFTAQALALLFAVPVIGMAVWSAGTTSQISWVPRPSLLVPLELTTRFSGVQFLIQHEWWWGLAIWIIWLGLAIWGMLRLQPDCFSPSEGRLFLGSWAIVPVGILLLISWSLKPIYVHRYVLFTLPAYLLMISGGIVSSRRNRLVLLSAAVLLCSQAYAVHEMPNSSAYTRPDWRAVQRNLAAAIGKNDRVLFHTWLLKRPFDYYNAKGETIPEQVLDTVGVPQGAEVITDAMLVAEMERVEAEARAGCQRLWVIERESAGAGRWLDARSDWRRIRTDRFDGAIEVHLYEFRCVQ